MGLTVAVVGATGTIGRAVAEAFARNDYRVIAIARRHAPHVDGYDFVPLDAAADSLDGLFDGVDTVVNAAGGCWDLTEEQVAYQHIRLVDRLIGAVAGTGARLVHMGSIHEYGPVPEGVRIGEDVMPRPLSAYARAKLAGSQSVLRAGGVVLRAVNVSGPHTGGSGFLAAVLRHTKGQLVVAPSKRDYLDVRDLAEAVVRAATAAVGGRVINLGSGVATDLREIARMLAHGPLDIVDGPIPSNGGGWTCADIHLAETLLGWRPRIALADSLRATATTPLPERDPDPFSSRESAPIGCHRDLDHGRGVKR